MTNCCVFFTHQFVSQRISSDNDNETGDGDYMILITRELAQFLKDLKSSEDNFIANCAVFLKLAYGFLSFVEAYRAGDSFAVEYG